MVRLLTSLAAAIACAACALPVHAQALPAPAVTGPLQIPAAYTFNAGPFGTLNVNGIVSGIGLAQDNPLTGDQATHADLSNAQIFIQKTSGWWQFYIQAGAYEVPILGTPFLAAPETVTDMYGPVPVAFLKLAPAKNTSILIGALPGLVGAEYTFTFQNMNIGRGLLWNQENAVNRGVQVNQASGKFSASVSWNDGFYSNRYSWLSGALTYTAGPHSISFSGMGNLGETAFRTAATPVQNNGRVYALVYTYTKGDWFVEPYLQYGDVPANGKAGIVQGASTRGGALLVNRKFQHHLSLAGRGEYLSSTGSASEDAVNLLYGPGSGAWSVTLTPAFQSHGFFVRGDLALVSATRYAPGNAFGVNGMDRNQLRAEIETGFIF
jgi:hypothetical protein